MTVALDFFAQHWNRTPATLPGTGKPPVDRLRSFRVMVAASEPFRAGTRFQAIPDVRFFTESGQIRAPGEHLPYVADLTHYHYLERLSDKGFLLCVEQPLPLDFLLWSQVRDLLLPLWRQVGYPVLPVVAELTIGRGTAYPRDTATDANYATLTCVLHGALEVRLSGGLVLKARTGDVLYRPAQHQQTRDYGDGCLALDIRIPADQRMPSRAVKDLLAAQLQETCHDEVPYLSFPPSPGADGQVAAMEPLVEIGETLAKAGEGPELDCALRRIWARRVSAAGLEPVPSPRAPVPLSPIDRIRRIADIIRMPLEPGLWLWAVNGHSFTVHGSAAERLPQKLAGVTTIGDLVHGGRGAEKLLRTLYALRGIDRAEG